MSMWDVDRREPYTEIGIRRLGCIRCGAPACHQWNICSDSNRFRPLCLDCDIALNEMLLRWMGHPRAEQVAAVYAITALKKEGIMPAAKKTATVETVNQYKVPMKQWRKWSPAARAVFNKVYDFMMMNPALMVHPKAGNMKPVHWKTVAWNSGWIAADAVDDEIPQIVEDIDFKAKKTVKIHRVKKSA